MGKYMIKGGKPLYGSVTVSGSKNAALPVLFATLITHGESEIVNLPDIADVECAIDIIKFFGAEVERAGNTVYVNTEELEYAVPDCSFISRIRASTYLIGSCLARFGRAEIRQFGGCNFSNRPIDLHLMCAERFGAEASESGVSAMKLHSADIILPKKSVGATVNALLIASSIPSESRIIGGACEPHIDTLIEFLRSAGASISTEDGVITIRGGRLRGGKVYIPGDMIEAGTYLSAAACVGGCVRVCGFDSSELSSFVNVFRPTGVKLVDGERCLSLEGRPCKEVRVKTEPYPGFPTDLQPLVAPVLAVAHGGVIEETVWEGRFGYLDELRKFGVGYIVRANCAQIYPSTLRPARVRAVDLRGGAAAILAALSTDGESEVECAEVVGRGYENMAGKLRDLGAEIEYFD